MPPRSALDQHDVADRKNDIERLRQPWSGSECVLRRGPRLRERNQFPIIDFYCLKFIVRSLCRVVNSVFYEKVGMGVKFREGSGISKPPAIRSPTTKYTTAIAASF